MRDTADAIDEAARTWAVRFPLDADGEAALETWLAGDRRRQGALVRALAAWSMLDRAQAARPAGGILPAATFADDVFPPAATGASGIDRRRLVGMIGGGLAATMAGVAILPAFAPARERTGLGEIRRLPLRDGSLATINTDSMLQIALGAQLRRIDLVRGEAWFDVAKDKARPFVVDAGAIRVRAVGTAFSVRRMGSAALVSVTEGVVSAWSRTGRGEPVALREGQQATIDRTGAIAMAEGGARIQRELAWREGQIALEGDTLAEAVSEFNRYNSRKLLVGDPGLAGQRLVGLFRTNDPEAFAETVSTLLGAHVAREGDAIILTSAKEFSPA